MLDPAVIRISLLACLAVIGVAGIAHLPHSQLDQPAAALVHLLNTLFLYLYGH